MPLRSKYTRSQAVDHDLGDGRVAQQRLERTESEHLVGDLRGQAQAILAAERRGRHEAEALLRRLLDRASRRRREADVAAQLVRVELVDQFLVDARA